MSKLPFWRSKALTEMSEAEWESLCDGCAKCCLVKLEDEDTGRIDYTDVACFLLDRGTCRCADYAHRQQRVPDCVVLTPDTVAELAWMPSTCAYRLLAEGRDLYHWHPLISGNPRSVHSAGVSVLGRIVSEHDVEDAELPAHIAQWAR